MLDKENNGLPVADGNRLILIKKTRTERHGTDNHDYYFNEVDPSGEVAARLHVRDHMSIYPPHIVKECWLRTDMEGNEIGRSKHWR